MTCDEAKSQECKSAKEFADSCREAGAEIGIISVGGTPTCGSCDRFEGASEIHPGNYAFFDRWGRPWEKSLDDSRQNVEIARLVSSV